MASAAITEKLNSTLAGNGLAVRGERDNYIEVMEAATAQVWMSLQPATRADLEALALPEGFIVSGSGMAAMDVAGFAASPGQTLGDVNTMVISGLDFLNVARPGDIQPAAGPDEALTAAVDKTHIIGFEVERKVVLMDTPEGSFVEVVGVPDHDGELVLPEGATLREIKLATPWVLQLPTPTKAYFWMRSQGMRSFQGPVDVPSDAETI